MNQQKSTVLFCTIGGVACLLLVANLVLPKGQTTVITPSNDLTTSLDEDEIILRKRANVSLATIIQKGVRTTFSVYGSYTYEAIEFTINELTVAVQSNATEKTLAETGEFQSGPMAGEGFFLVNFEDNCFIKAFGHKPDEAEEEIALIQQDYSYFEQPSVFISARSLRYLIEDTYYQYENLRFEIYLPSSN